MKFHELPRDPNGFRLRGGFQDGPAADDLLGLDEGAIRYGDGAVLEADTGTLRAREEAARVDERAVLARRLYELSHRLHEGGGRGKFPIRLRAANERQVFHGLSFGCFRGHDKRG